MLCERLLVSVIAGLSVLVVLAGCPAIAPGAPNDAQATVPPGDYLALVHNLGRDDLTFVAQFVKDGATYTRTEYRENYGGPYRPITGPTLFKSAPSFEISATTLPTATC